MEYLESPYPALKDEAQTAEYTTPGPEPNEVTTLGTQDCHHCPHKSMLLDSHSRLHTPATSGLWRSTLTTIDRNQIQLATGPSLSLPEVQSLLTLKWEGPQRLPAGQMTNLMCRHSAWDVTRVQVQTHRSELVQKPCSSDKH